jgi:hypothetical protein
MYGDRIKTYLKIEYVFSIVCKSTSKTTKILPAFEGISVDINVLRNFYLIIFPQKENNKNAL